LRRRWDGWFRLQLSEMLVFSGVHLRAETEDSGPMYYWLGVAAVCVVIALGRLFVVPL
jgi:hypothetical protein